MTVFLTDINTFWTTVKVQDVFLMHAKVAMLLCCSDLQELDPTG